jgi:tetratricopeptide (TPR) repeat protein
MRRALWMTAWVLGLGLFATGRPAPASTPAGEAASRPAAGDVAARAYGLRMSGKADEARALLERHTAAHPTDAAARWELARTLFYLMEMDGAVEQAAAAVREAPDNPRYLHLQGIVCTYGAIRKHARGRRDEARPLALTAIGAWEKAVKLKPDFDDARGRLIGCYARLPDDHGGDQEKAEALVRQAEARSAICGALAHCELTAGEAEANAERLRKAMKASGETAAGLAALADQLARADKFDEAAACIERCVKRDPSRSDVLLWVGRSCAWRKEYQKADKLFRKYLALKPPPPRPLRAWALFARGVVQMRQGNNEPAEALRKEARKLDRRYWGVAAPPPRELLTAP